MKSVEAESKLYSIEFDLIREDTLLITFVGLALQLTHRNKNEHTQWVLSPQMSTHGRKKELSSGVHSNASLTHVDLACSELNLIQHMTVALESLEVETLSQSLVISAFEERLIDACDAFACYRRMREETALPLTALWQLEYKLDNLSEPFSI